MGSSNLDSSLKREELGSGLQFPIMPSLPLKKFLAANQPAPWELLKNQIYLGSDVFVEQMVARLDEQDPLSEAPAIQEKTGVRSLIYDS